MRGHGAWLALEPRLEVKLALAEHLAEDAEWLARAPADPAPPSTELAALLDRTLACLDPLDYEEMAYGELKPLVAAGARAAGPPDLALAERQDRHVLELALPVTQPRLRLLEPGREPWTPVAGPPAGAPARDPFVTIDPEHAPRPDDADPGAAAHAQLDAALSRLEALAAAGDTTGLSELLDRIHELDRRLAEELDCPWGTHPVRAERST